MLVLGGDALDDVQNGQSLTWSSTVVVFPAVWDACSKDKFLSNVVHNSKFVEIILVSTYVCVSTH